VKRKRYMADVRTLNLEGMCDGFTVEGVNGRCNRARRKGHRLQVYSLTDGWVYVPETCICVAIRTNTVVAPYYRSSCYAY